MTFLIVKVKHIYSSWDYCVRVENSTTSIQLNIFVIRLLLYHVLSFWFHFCWHIFMSTMLTFTLTYTICQCPLSTDCTSLNPQPIAPLPLIYTIDCTYCICRSSLKYFTHAVHPINVSSFTISPDTHPSIFLPLSISAFIPPFMPLALPPCPIHYFIPPLLFPAVYSTPPSIYASLLTSLTLSIHPFFLSLSS